MSWAGCLVVVLLVLLGSKSRWRTRRQHQLKVAAVSFVLWASVVTLSTAASVALVQRVPSALQAIASNLGESIINGMLPTTTAPITTTSVP